MRIIAALTAALLPLAAAAQDDLPRVAFGEDGARQMSITWNTEDDSPSLVEVRAGNEEWARHEGQSERWAPMGRFVHSVSLDDLEPDTSYRYRVGDGVSWAGPFAFRTGPVDLCQAYRFVALGDDRSQDDFGPSLNWGPILQEALEEGPAFALNGGDLVHNGDQPEQWFNWLVHTADGLTDVPHMPTLGNHDDDSVDGDGAAYNLLFTLPRNDQTGTEDYYFFTYGDLIVVSLSTVTFKGNAFAEQAQWLDDVLTAHPKRWKIVMLHHPIYTSTLLGLMHPPDEAGQNAALVPVFDTHHVDLVLQSHNHWYQRFVPSFGGGGSEQAEPVDDDADGTVYLTTGGAGAYTVDIGAFLGVLDLECAFTPGCAVLRGEHHYLLFEMEQNQLTVTVKATAAQNFGNDPANREVIDRFELVKAGDERIDCEALQPEPPDAAVEPPPPGPDAAPPPPPPPLPDAAIPPSDRPDAATPAVLDAAPAAEPDGSSVDTGSPREPARDAAAPLAAPDGGAARRVLPDAANEQTSPAGDGGCACRATGGSPLGLAGLALLLALPRRRRRR